MIREFSENLWRYAMNDCRRGGFAAAESAVEEYSGFVVCNITNGIFKYLIIR